MDLFEKNDLNLIPEPQEIAIAGPEFAIEELRALRTGLDKEDLFALDYFASRAQKDLGVQLGDSSNGIAVRISRTGDIAAEGYTLSTSPEGISISGRDAAGVYYALQTLLQCFRKTPKGIFLPTLKIRDWPDLKYRAMHYDTKHSQGTRQYVEDFIRELASFKVNVLVWEWEDKFGYEKHPAIAAPGAYTKQEMQAFSRLAQSHHMQIVPLIQGLGHVSYILKHPQYKHLRDVPDSNWELCPLKEGTYELLSQLYDEAIEATPGSELLHIGSDETYDLGLGEECGCRKKAEEIGHDGLMQIFIKRCVAHVEKRGRKALSWGGRWHPNSKHTPPKEMTFVDSGDLEYLSAARQAGYKVWIYASNPGIEPLFLSFFPWTQQSMWRADTCRIHSGAFQETGEIAKAAKAKVVDGSITTSWEDSGLHNQCWMPRFICAAEFSWKADGRDVNTWARRYFRNYFGTESRDMRELFVILQESANFYYDTFQRRIWHWGDVGKIHVPDFPREDLEFSDFWRTRYAKLIHAATAERQKLQRALEILDDNLARDVRHKYDLEIFRSCAELMRHNADLILMLGNLENAISQASDYCYFGGERPLTPANRKQALIWMRKAEAMIADHLADRAQTFSNLVAVWEKTRLPKGLSLPQKPFFHQKDRARHFANRTADMNYLILDEQILDLEGYLDKLRAYNNRLEQQLNQ